MKKLFLNLFLWLFPIRKMTKNVVEELIKIDREIGVLSGCRECLGAFIRFFSLYSSFQITFVDRAIKVVRRRNIFGQHKELLNNLIDLRKFFEDIKKNEHNRSKNEPVTIFNIFLKDRPIFDWLVSDEEKDLLEANLNVKNFLINKSIVIKKFIESLNH